MAIDLRRAFWRPRPFFTSEEKYPGTLAVGHDDSFEPEALAGSHRGAQWYIWGRSFPPYSCSERNRPDKECVTVSYGPGTVAAEYLGDCLACIAGVSPTGDEVFIGDVVRVSSEPTPSNVPDVTEVIYSPFPCLTKIRYEGEGNLVLLQTLFRTIGAACYPFGVAGPSGEGFAIVGHSERIDPEALAHAAGFRQHDDKDDEDEDGEADEDADTDEGEGEVDPLV